MWVAKRGRLDIELAIYFLCTRVSCSTEEDWEKLRRLLSYLQQTKDTCRILGADGLEILQTLVDASCSTHEVMKSHTGGIMSMGHGVIHNKCSTQKLNTKSSTEAELVGAIDYIPYTLWTKNFLEEQEYNKRHIFYQDNQSAMRIEKNRRSSAGEKSSHIHIRYFFIKDVLLSENIDLQYCPTERMIADFFY